MNSPYQRMDTAPLDGTAVLVLLDGSDVPHAARYVEGVGWHLVWDNWKIPEYDGPRWWMPCPPDPDTPSTEQNGEESC